MHWQVHLFALCLLTTLSARADDIFYLATDGRTETKASGTILDFTRRELTIKSVSSRETIVAAERVRRIEYVHGAPQLAADQAFDAGQMEKAKQQYAVALKAELRPWVRREIAAQIVRCWTAVGDQNQSIERAGNLFLELAREDCAPSVFAAIPLCWFDREPSPGLIEQAKKWRASEMPEAQLLGASWLLVSDRAGSLPILQSLAAHRSPYIAQLAASQLWRAELATVDLKAVERWQKELDKFQPALRAGGWFVVGRGWSGQEPGRAALAYMRVAIYYPGERLLASESQLAAAGELVAREEISEAQVLWQEIVAHYPESPAAKTAAEQLRRGSK